MVTPRISRKGDAGEGPRRPARHTPEETRILLQWAVCPGTWGRELLRPPPGIKHTWLTRGPRGVFMRGLTGCSAHWISIPSENLPPGSPNPRARSPSKMAAQPSLFSQVPRWSERVASGLCSARGESTLERDRVPGPGLHSPQPSPCVSLGRPGHTPPRRPLPSPFPVASWVSGRGHLSSVPRLLLLCSTTVDSAEVWFLFCRASFLRFFLLSLCLCLCLCLSLLPLPAPAPGASSFHPGWWAAHPWQGRPDGGAILGLRAFGTG